MPEPVNCANFEELAVLYALGELEPLVRAAVEEHARVCSDCAAKLQRETVLSGILAANSQPPDDEPSDLLLSRCRKDFTDMLDRVESASRPRVWTLSPREWLASFRISPHFHPAWSATALVLVAALSGFAGWQGIGQAPLQDWGPTLMTVSAAPPPLPAPAPPAALSSAPDAIGNKPEITAPASAPLALPEDLHIYSATGAAVGDSARSFDSANAHSWRHIPPPRLPTLSSTEVWEAPDAGRFAELSRRMESLWWGGIRIDPAEQQQRLVHGPAPEYPEVARRAAIEGQVTLLVRINRDGSVEDSEQLSGDPVLGRAAAAAVDRWRYSPLRIGGRPVNILTSVTFNFRLQ